MCGERFNNELNKKSWLLVEGLENRIEVVNKSNKIPRQGRSVNPSGGSRSLCRAVGFLKIILQILEKLFFTREY